jgi:hypothetical protein
MFNGYFRSSTGDNQPLPLSPLFQRTEQRMVRDEVKFQPVRNALAELSEASERLSAGRPILDQTELPARNPSAQ